MAGLRNSIEDYVLHAALELTTWPETAERLREEHREIVAAIARGDEIDAARRVRQHITGYYLGITARGSRTSLTTESR
jgi:DNA-binding GntR family transcriptional regulator